MDDRKGGATTIYKLRDDGVKYMRLATVTPYGTVDAKYVPMSEIDAYISGYGIDPKVIDRTLVGGALPDVTAVPDLATCAELPAFGFDDIRVASMWCDLYGMDGNRHPLCVRGGLKTAMENNLGDGENFITGSEREYYVREADGTIDKNAIGEQVADPKYRLLLSTMDVLRANGVPITKAHPENGPAQYEQVIKHGNALTTADNYVTTGIIMDAKAAEGGRRVDRSPFMGDDISVNSEHLNMSVLSGDKNLFANANGVGVSDFGRAFAEGILDNNGLISAVANTSENSYRALAKIAKTLAAGDSRKDLIRLKNGLIEYRGTDSSMDIYSTLAMMLSAGMMGARGRVPVDGKFRRQVVDVPDSVNVLEDAMRSGYSLGLSEEMLNFHIKHRKAEMGVGK